MTPQIGAGTPSMSSSPSDELIDCSERALFPVAVVNIWHRSRLLNCVKEANATLDKQWCFVTVSIYPNLILLKFADNFAYLLYTVNTVTVLVQFGSKLFLKAQS